MKPRTGSEATAGAPAKPILYMKGSIRSKNHAPRPVWRELGLAYAAAHENNPAVTSVNANPHNGVDSARSGHESRLRGFIRSQAFSQGRIYPNVDGIPWALNRIAFVACSVVNLEEIQRMRKARLADVRERYDVRAPSKDGYRGLVVIKTGYGLISVKLRPERKTHKEVPTR